MPVEEDRLWFEPSLTARTGWQLSNADTSLSEEEIIRLYGKCWDIEVFFKTCKSYLEVPSATACPADALTAHTSIVMVRYCCWHWNRESP